MMDRTSKKIKQRVVRVFVSSTFRDMHSERDYLVKVVFPRLREKLEQYRIHLIDIDLRWGVTAEQADNDMALDLCLQQIDECRPYFIGILGERYGWVPKSFADEAASKHGWIQHHTGKSITELEILYGVLKKPQMQSHAFFFFRDKSSIKDVPYWKQADMLPEDEDSARKLSALKDTIRSSETLAPVFDNYPCKYAGLKINSRILRLEVNDDQWETLKSVIESGFVNIDKYDFLEEELRDVIAHNTVVYLDGLKEFGERVYNQLWQAIKIEHELPDVPPVDTLAKDDPLAHEAQFHEKFIESRTRIYIGREKVQRELMEFVNSTDTFPCLVTGPSGSGKSAALAKFIQNLIEKSNDELIIPHFVGASPTSTSLRQMLRRFCEILKDNFNYEDEIPFDINKLVDCFRKFLGDVPEDRPTVILIDALNQLDETDNAHAMYWIPRELPCHVKVVVSCIEDPDKQEKVLQSFEHCRYQHIKIEPLTVNERLEIVREVPSLSAKTLDPKQVGLLLSNPATENPLFLLVVLEELRGFGSFELLNDRIKSLPKGRNSNTELFIQVIERLEDDFEAEIVEQMLCYLACSRNGMTQRELLELIEGIGTEESTSDLFPVLRQLRPYLQYRADAIDFFHRNLFKAVLIRFLDKETKKSYHCQLAGYFRKKADPSEDFTWIGGYARGLLELPYHITEGCRWDDMKRTMTDYRFLDAKIRSFGPHPVISDYSLVLDIVTRLENKSIVEDESLRLLQGAILLSEHVLSVDRSQLAPQLFGRLLGHEHPTIQRLLKQVLQCREDVWFRPLQRCLDSPEGALVRTFLGREPLAITPDDFCISAGSDNQSLQVVDFKSGNISYTIPDPSRWRGLSKKVIAVTPDGYLIVTKSGGELKVWDLENKNFVKTLFTWNDSITSIAVTPDGRYLICSFENSSPLAILDLKRGSLLRKLNGHSYGVCAVAVSLNGLFAVSGSKDRTLKVWNLESGQLLRTLEGHSDRVLSVALTPDGRFAVSGSSDKTLKIWNVETGSLVSTLSGHSTPVVGVAVMPDGQHLVSSDWRYLRVWDLETGKLLNIFGEHEIRVGAMVITKNGRYVISAGTDKVKVWDSEKLFLNKVKKRSDIIESIAITQDGSYALSGASHIKVWSIESGEPVRMLKETPGSIAPIYYINVTPCGRYVVYKPLGRKIRLRNFENGVFIRSFINSKHASSLTVTPDGRYVIFSRPSDKDRRQKVFWGSESGEAIRWFEVRDLESGDLIHRFGGNSEYVHVSAVTPDGCIMVSGNDNTLKVWNIRSGELIRTLLNSNPISGFSITPDGRKVISYAEDETVKVWNLGKGTLERTLTGSFDWRGISVTPDGRYVICVSWLESKLGVWEIESTLEISTFTTESRIKVLGMGIAQGGRIFAVGLRGRVCTFSLENLKTGQAFATAVRLYRLSEDRSSGEWDDIITTLCTWCGQRFAPSSKMLDVIESITRNTGLLAEQSPCLELPQEAWEDPQLLSKCPHCHKPLKFNPFIVDNRV